MLKYKKVLNVGITMGFFSKVSGIYVQRLSLILFLVLLSFFPTKIFSQLIKPSPSLSPYMVVKHQLEALKRNDIPYMGAGVKQTWALAHPDNKKMTGPLEKFNRMIQNSHYKILLNHRAHKISLIRKNKKVHVFDVRIISQKNNVYSFEWKIQKVLNISSVKDCWLTIAVSIPRKKSSAI